MENAGNQPSSGIRNVHTLHNSNFLKTYSIEIEQDGGWEIANFFEQIFARIPPGLYTIIVRLGFELLSKNPETGEMFPRKFAPGNNTTCYESKIDTNDNPEEVIDYFNEIGSLREFAIDTGSFQIKDSSTQLVAVDEALVQFWSLECEPDLL